MKKVQMKLVRENNEQEEKLLIEIEELKARISEMEQEQEFLI